MSQNQSDTSKTALDYVEKYGWWLLPCQWEGPRRKQPLLRHGFHDASNDPAQIAAWWGRWPNALLGVATGRSRLAVLDVDVKDPAKFGPDSLAELGHRLDHTWIAHTASGGWHSYYHADLDDGCDIPSTEDVLGPGLDVRGNTGYVITPSPGSGYSWDPINNPDTLSLAPAPAWLIPPTHEPVVLPRAPVKKVVGLSPYADAAIERACLNIRHAPSGQQRVTLRDESFSIGTLAGADGIAPAFARAALIDAGYGMQNFDPKHPWTGKEVARIVNAAFTAGFARPRRAVA